MAARLPSPSPSPSGASGRERLERIRLAGPGGSASLDTGSERPMTITRDAASGRVLSLLRGGGTPDAAPAPGRELEVRFSRGVPDEAAWQR